MTIKPGDRAVVRPRDDFPAWMKEMAEIDPTKVTVLTISGERALVEPKMGDEPYWVDVSRLIPREF